MSQRTHSAEVSKVCVNHVVYKNLLFLIHKLDLNQRLVSPVDGLSRDLVVHGGFMWQLVFDVVLLWAVHGWLLVIHQTFYSPGKTQDSIGYVLQYPRRGRWRPSPQSYLFVFLSASITGSLLSFIWLKRYTTDQPLSKTWCLYLYNDVDSKFTKE